MADDEDRFEVVPTAGGGIEAWTIALSHKLAEVIQGPTRTVTISDTKPDGAYLQCLVPHQPGVWCEAKSNEFYDNNALSLSDEAGLLALGWQPPTIGTPEADEVGEIPNWWIAVDRPVDCERLANLLVDTLLDCYHVSVDETWVLAVTDGHCTGCWE